MIDLFVVVLQITICSPMDTITHPPNICIVASLIIHFGRSQCLPLYSRIRLRNLRDRESSGVDGEFLVSDSVQFRIEYGLDDAGQSEREYSLSNCGRGCGTLLFLPGQ